MVTGFTYKQSMASYFEALMVRDSGGEIATVTDGKLDVNSTEDQKSAFNEVLVAELTPKVQIDFNYTINSRIASTTVDGSGATSTSNSKAVLQTTANANSSATLESKRVVKYDPGQGALARFTAVFTTGVANSNQEAGIGDDTDGFFFGYNGASFGIMSRQNGADTWVASSSWNGDPADGTQTLPAIDPTKGNVYQIRYQWLGFGAITFWIENPINGKFILVHTIQYANANTDPSIFNPTLPLRLHVANTSNTSDIQLQSSSMAGFVEGKEVKLGPKNATSTAKASVGTTETNILTIRNKATFQSKKNRVEVELDFIGAAVDGTKPAIVYITKNATLGGSPSYSDIDTSTSVVEADNAGTTVTGGQRLFIFAVSKADSIDLPLGDLSIDLEPNDTLTVSVEAISGTTDVGASLSWIERF